MKKRFYIKAAFGLLMVSALFSSCLKDTVRQPDFTVDAPVIDFPTVAFGSATPTATILAANTTNSLNVLIAASAPHDYTTPTNVTLTVLTQAQLTAKVATGILLPASTYAVSSLSTNINPGITQRIYTPTPMVGAVNPMPSASLGVISFIINTAAFQALDQTKTYYLPVQITGASGNGAVIDQYSTVYYKIAIK